MKTITLALFLAVGILGSASHIQAAESNLIAGSSLTAPTVLTPVAGQILSDPQPVFAGVTYNWTKVDVYIDGAYSGRAKVKNHPSGTASWSYRAFLPLKNGNHQVLAVARSESESLRSPESPPIHFRVEPPLPAPTLFKPAPSEGSIYRRPWISGVAKNGSFLDVYVDGRLDGTLPVIDQPSGTASFKYLPGSELLPGWHAVTVRARDARGKNSRHSLALVFEIKDRATDRTAPNAPQLPAMGYGPATAVTAPTLVSPVVGTVTTNTQPVISGAARNNQIVQIFIDGVLNGTVPSQTHASGVFGFAYKPFLKLEPGLHSVTARTETTDGSLSSLSNGLNFIVLPPDSRLAISPSGVTMTQLTTASSQVAATSTQSTAAPSAAEPTPSPTNQATPKPTTIGEPTPKADEISEGSTTDNEIVVIGDQQATGSAATESKGNTLLVVILAVSAIVIIGLISWYTSRSGSQTSEDKTTEQSTNESSPPRTESAWEEELVNKPENPPTLVYEEEDVPPPPPPPPALGI